MTVRSASTRSVLLGLLGSAVALLPAGCGLFTTPQQVRARIERNLAAHDYRAAAVDLENLVTKQPNDRTLRLELARALLHTGAYVPSEENYRKAQQLGASWPSVVAGLAEALLDEGKPQQALDLLAAHAPGGTPDSRALTLRGRAWLALGQLDEARSALTQAISLEPADVPARVALAGVLERDGDRAGAKAALDPAIAAAPGDFQAHFALATWYLRGRQIGAAHTELLRSLHAAVAGIRAGSEPGFEEYRTLVPLAETELVLGDVAAAKQRLARLRKLAPHQAPTLLVQARIDLKERRTAEARTVLQELLSHDPNNVTAQVLLGDADAAAGQLGQAEMYLNAALTAAPGDLVARELLARVQLAEREPLNALRTATAPSAAPDPELLSIAAQASARSGDPASAIRYLEHSAASAPDDKMRALALAAAYIRGNRSDDALKLLESLKVPDALAVQRESLVLTALSKTGMTDEVQAEANRFAAERSSELAALMLASRALVATRDVAGAHHLLEQATRLKPPSPQPWIALGLLAAAEKDRAAADAAFDRALQIDPRGLVALVVETRLALAAADFPATDRLIVRLEAAKAPGPLVLSLQGDLAVREGKLQDALRDYTSAAGAAPSSELAMKMTSVRYKLHDADAAAPLQGWVKRFPHDARAQLVLAQFLQAAGDSAGAAQAYQTVLADVPKDVIALNNLAWLRVTTGDTVAGLALARRAYAIAPSAPSVADTLGWALVQSGKAAEAVAILRAAHQAAPHNAQIDLHLATALMRTGNRSAARRELEEIVDGEPQAPQAQKARSMLASLGSAAHP